MLFILITTRPKETYKVESNGGVIGLSSLNYDEMSFGPGAALNPSHSAREPGGSSTVDY